VKTLVIGIVPDQIAAARLMMAAGEDLVVCRLGGDEFMVLVPGANEQQGQELMDDIRNKLTESNREDGYKYARSLSYGVVMVEADSGEHSSGELLGLADERMYAYKRAHKVQRRDLTN
jgi:diguanylate cyclase (GGDEF)-like protein